MNATDTLAISQRLQGLEKPALHQAATALATQNADLATQNATQTSKIQQFERWFNENVPKHIGRRWRLAISVTTGGAVGVAYGALPHPWALVASAATAAASGVVAVMAENPDYIDAALAVTSGASATALGIELAKSTSEFMAKRAAAKTNTAVAAAPAPKGAKG
jgi:hypothetical protein